MRRGTLAFLGLAVLPAALAVATCNSTTPCPSTAPCCSEYGYCGTGSFCLGGCEPLYSFTDTSCLPEPVCQSTQSTFTDLSRVLTNGTSYTGNATAYDWIVSKGSLELDPDGNGVRLILTETNGGTLISSTRYVHFGQIDFVLETSKWAGVVTAAITMSDVKDEIDWEWTGNATTSAQSNYFFLGYANYTKTNGGTHDVTSGGDTSQNFHTYSLNWQEDKLEWLIDGNSVRTLNKADTFNEEAGQYWYPSTPSRVQISIWPAGIDSSAAGTVAWAGGMIDWSDPDYVAHGYFYNTLQSVKISCADQPDSDTTGYAYLGNDSSNVPYVGFTNKSTVVGAARPGAVASVGLAGIFSVAAVAAVSLPWMTWSLF